MRRGFLIDFHALRLLWVMLIVVMISSHLLLFLRVVYNCVTSLYSTVVKRVVCILLFWNIPSRSHTHIFSGMGSTSSISLSSATE